MTFIAPPYTSNPSRNKIFLLYTTQLVSTKRKNDAPNHWERHISFPYLSWAFFFHHLIQALWAVDPSAMCEHLPACEYNVQHEQLPFILFVIIFILTVWSVLIYMRWPHLPAGCMPVLIHSLPSTWTHFHSRYHRKHYLFLHRDTGTPCHCNR